MTYYRHQLGMAAAEVLADALVANELVGELRYDEGLLTRQLAYLYAAIIDNESMRGVMSEELRAKIVLALELYRRQIGDNQEGWLGVTISDLYAEVVSNEEMETSAVMAEAMLQYHLGRSLYRQQSKLLRDFYSEINYFGGLKPTFIKRTQAQGNTNLLLTADIKLNGELLGILSI